MIRAFSKISNSFKRVKSKMYFAASKMPFYYITLLSNTPRVLKNVGRLDLPLEFSVDLISNGYVVFLKSSARSIFVKDIQSLIESQKISQKEKEELHSFDWIAFLHINLDRQLKVYIRKNILYWIKHFKDSSHFSWDPVITAQRIYNWVCQYHLISNVVDLSVNEKILNSLMKQWKYLKRIRYLLFNPVEKSYILKAIVLMAASLDEKKMVKESVEIINQNFKDCSLISKCKNTNEILSLLRNLLEIQFYVSCYKLGFSDDVLRCISELAGVVTKLRHSDGGISMFNSEFNPSVTYIDSILSHVKKYMRGNYNDGYLKLSSINSYVFIDANDRFFPFEFSSNYQRIIAGSYLLFKNGKTIGGSKKTTHMLHTENKNYWFCGESEFFVNGTKVQYLKKMYLDQLGTDVRCEEIIENGVLDLAIYLFLPSDVTITPVDPQNGFIADFITGERWTFTFEKNLIYSFEYRRESIQNGKIVYYNLLSLTVPRQDNKSIFRWSLKRL